MIAATLGVVGVVLLALVLAATQRSHRHRARPASRSPRLIVAGSGQRGNAVGSVGVGRRSTAPGSPAGPWRSSAAPPTAAPRSRPGSPFPHGGFEWPQATAGRLPDGPEPPPSETVAGPVHAVRHGRAMALATTALAATISVSLLVGRGPGLLLLAGSGCAPLARRLAARRAASRLRAERASAAPAVIDLLGACLLAGLNPYRSLIRVAERSPGALQTELARAAAELDTGRTPAAALRAVAERTRLDELRAAAAALEAAERWGAPPAEALAARAEALRSRARLTAEAEAGRAAVRLAFPLVFCFLPAFVLLVVIPTMAGALRVLAP